LDDIVQLDFEIDCKYEKSGPSSKLPDKNTNADEQEKKTENDKEKKTSESSKRKLCDITLGEFLDVLDGIIEMSGRMIIFTTNHVDVLDPAIIRPGRVDHVIEIRRLTKQNVKDMYRHWFDRELPTDVEQNMCDDRTFTQAEMGKLFLTKNMAHIHGTLCVKHDAHHADASELNMQP
jgi:SpoVK/Ycf46/Vps4 family AAA+-type ATPase